MKKTIALFACAMVLSSCTMTSEQRTHVLSKEIEARLELAKLPIAEAEEARNLKVYSQDRSLPPLPEPDLQKWLDAGIKAGFIGLGAYGIHELSGNGDSTVINNNGGSAATGE